MKYIRVTLICQMGNDWYRVYILFQIDKKNKALKLAAEEQKKADESAMKLAGDHKVISMLILNRLEGYHDHIVNVQSS